LGITGCCEKGSGPDFGGLTPAAIGV